VNYASAQTLSRKIKRSSKLNRIYKVIGVLVSRGNAYVQCVHKETGHPVNFGHEKTSPRNDILSDEEINEIWAKARRRGQA